MAQIETIHRCQIDYNHANLTVPDYDALDRVRRKAIKFAAVEGENIVELCGSGGSTAGPSYLLLQSGDYECLDRVAGKIERYINRLKNVRLH